MAVFESRRVIKLKKLLDRNSLVDLFGKLSALNCGLHQTGPGYMVTQVEHFRG